MSKPGTLFDVRGNLMTRKRSFSLSDDAMFFTSRDKAAQYRATHPGWQNHAEWSANVNKYVAGKLSLAEAMPALLWKFRTVWQNHDDEGCQTVLGKVAGRDGEDGLELFMAAATKEGMRVEYTKPGEERGQPNSSYLKIDVPPSRGDDGSRLGSHKETSIEIADAAAQYLTGGATFAQSFEALGMAISGMINATRYPEAARLLERIGVKEGAGAGKKLVNYMIAEDLLHPPFVVEFNDYLDREWGRDADTTLTRAPEVSPSRGSRPPAAQIPYAGGRLCDHILANVSALKIATAYRNGDPERASASVENAVNMIKNAPRYLLDHKSLDLIGQIASGKADLSSTRAPSGIFWLEVQAAHGRTFGVLWIGAGNYNTVEDGITDGDLTKGHYVTFVIDGGQMFSIRCGGEIGKLPEEVSYGHGKKIRTPGGDEQDINWLSRMVAAFCFLMNSPKITAREPVEFDKLNKQRERSGKTRLLPYTSVRLTIEGRVSSGGGGSGNKGEPGDKHGKRRHLVSYFTRLKGGRIEHVRPHWRGDASLGTIIGKKVRT